MSRRPCRLPRGLLLPALLLAILPAAAAGSAPFHEARLIFPPEAWHVHASCVVELPNGDLLACWFHGSGERTADDVKIEGARLPRGSTTWSPRFVLADTPNLPDCNPTMFIDPRGRLWLLWVTIQSNQWESALLKFQTATDYLGAGPPRWNHRDVIHLQPPPEFAAAALAFYDHLEQDSPPADPAAARKQAAYLESVRARARDKLSQRLGWMPRAHPFVDGSRLILPLYSDGFDFSLMALSDDDGATWRTSPPLLGAGNIQPSIVRRRDGSLYTLMRDNGPPPQRLHQSESHDHGETWSRVTDSTIPNPGSGAEIIALRSGNWALISNDTESGRHRLTVQISDDEGKSWKWRRALEDDPPGPAAGRYHYPSLLQAADGSLHATYSHHQRAAPADATSARRVERKAIKHAHFNAAWVQQGHAP